MMYFEEKNYISGVLGDFLKFDLTHINHFKKVQQNQNFSDDIDFAFIEMYSRKFLEKMSRFFLLVVH